MANPTPYKRSFSFDNYQTDTPDQPLPGVRVDIELDNIAQKSKELTDVVNAGFIIDANMEQIATVAEEIDKVVFVADNMNELRQANEWGPDISLAVDLFLGAFAVDPAEGHDGDPLVLGATYYNTTIGESRVWNGNDWVPVAKVSLGGILQGSITVTTGTEFYIGDYVSLSVALNGDVLAPGVAYTMTSPTITVPSAVSGDEITYFGVLKGSETDAASFVRQTFLTSAGVQRYTLNSSGAPLALTQTNHILFGGSPFGPLTYGVDYTVSTGGVDLAYVPAAGELYSVFSMPRFTNSEAQAVLQDYKDAVADAITGKGAPQSWAEFQAEEFLNVADGAVYWFNDVQFVRDRSADIAGLRAGAGWGPLGEPSANHFTSQATAAPSILAGSVPLRPSATVDVDPEDQSVSLQNALDYAADWGKFIEAPEGVYGVDGYKGARATWTAGQWAHGGLILRAGTRIVGAGMGKTVFRNIAPNWRSVMRPTGGRVEIKDLSIDGNIGKYANIILGTTSATAGTARGEGFVTTFTEGQELFLENIEVVNTGHYGIGLQNGKIVAGTMRNLHFRNIGGDPIDIKTYSTPDQSKRLIIQEVWCHDGCGHNYVGGAGVSPHNNQACVDIGGPTIVEGVRIFGLDSYGTQLGNVGVRTRASVNSEGRTSAEYCQVSDVYIESSKGPSEGNGTLKRIIGVHVNSPHTRISGVVARRCLDGVRVSSSGDSTPNNSIINDVIATDCTGEAGGGSGIRIEGGVSGILGGNYHAEACDSGVVITSSNHAINGIRMVNNGTGLRASDAIMRSCSLTGLSFSGNAADTTSETAPTSRGSVASPANVVGDRTGQINLVSTFDGAGWSGVPFGRLSVFKADTTGVDPGEVARWDYRSTGDSGGDGRWAAAVKLPDGNWLDVFTASREVTSVNVPLRHVRYTTAQVLAIASPAVGMTVYCTDGDAGQPCLAVHDGTSWRRIPLGADISTS